MPSRACASEQAGADLPRGVRRTWPWLRMVLTAALCVTGLSYLALAYREARPALQAADADERFGQTVFAASWQVVPAAPAAYELELGQPAGAALRRESRRHGGTGLREDTLLLGSFDDGRSHLALTLERGPLPAERLGLFVDLTRRAAPAGLALLRMGALEVLPTKFGEVEAAAVTLAGRSERACLAFRWSDPERDFAFKGWHCAADPAAVRAELACLLDRLNAAASADRALRARFAEADARRLPGCRLPSASFASRAVAR